MSEIQKHYDDLLGDHYSWALGGHTKKLQENRELFNALDIAPRSSGLAVDLGAGSGFQSIPLAERGFSVVAVDLCSKLLDETTNYDDKLNIEIVEGDLLEFVKNFSRQVELVVCMGDTLPHLESLDGVETLTQEVYRILEPGGFFLMAFRDLTKDLNGVDRFIPVRTSVDKIFSCFLEYEEGRVRVNDIVYVQEGKNWKMLKSSYWKLRIPFEWMVDCIKKTGFQIEKDTIEKGMITLMGKK